MKGESRCWRGESRYKGDSLCRGESDWLKSLATELEDKWLRWGRRLWGKEDEGNGGRDDAIEEKEGSSTIFSLGGKRKET